MINNGLHSPLRLQPSVRFNRLVVFLQRTWGKNVAAAAAFGFHSADEEFLFFADGLMGWPATSNQTGAE